MVDRLIEPLHPEKRRSVEENPRITTLLGGAGLTAVDLQFFDRLYQQEQAVFVHGSIMANRVTPKSDIDFTVIGELDKLSTELRDTLMPGLLAVQSLRHIDYISTSIQSQEGRKVSMHMSEPDFRDDYPTVNKPYATEYRPGRHAKSGARKYFLPGADKVGGVHLINFLAHSDVVGDDGSAVTDIPQTGRFVIKGNSVFIDGKEHLGLTAESIVRLGPNGEEIDVPNDQADEVMVLGLEFDKMASDTPMYNDPDAENRFVKEPSRRSMEALGEFTGADPSVITKRLFGELAKHWPKVKPHKQR